MRVWAIGNDIITSILRESDTDFRSNFCLGGRATPYKMNEEEKSLVKRILSLVESDYIGIDFLFDGGHLIFNEIGKSEFTGSVTRKPKRYTGKKRLRKE